MSQMSLSELVAESADASDRRVVLLCGVTGDGKSSTANTLHGSQNFEVSDGLSSATQKSSYGDFIAPGNVPTRVIDTIGFSDTTLSHAQTLDHFRSFAEHAPYGIDCFLFVVRWGRFKPEHEEALETFARTVGDAALSRTVLCFTHAPSGPADDPAVLQATLASPSVPPALARWLQRLSGAVAIDNSTCGVVSHPRLGDNDAGNGERDSSGKHCHLVSSASCTSPLLATTTTTTAAAAAAGTRLRLHEAIAAVVEAHGGERYSNETLDEARSRHAAAEDAERAAFAAAVRDWRRQGSGPIVVQREAANAGSTIRKTTTPVD